MVVAGERPAKEEVSFSSDKEGNYYFNGRKVKVENSDEYAYRLLKTKIQTSYRRPVDFYFRFLARFGPYGTYGNVYYPSITDCDMQALPAPKPQMNSGKAMDNGSPPFLLYNFFNINHYGNSISNNGRPRAVRFPEQQRRGDDARHAPAHTQGK
ncbi:hypothetical protein NIB75_06605 [Bacteroides uniformis]|nr:hypothetical protein [Bacteroides uniformis]